MKIWVNKMKLKHKLSYINKLFKNIDSGIWIKGKNRDDMKKAAILLLFSVGFFLGILLNNYIPVFREYPKIHEALMYNYEFDAARNICKQHKSDLWYIGVKQTIKSKNGLEFGKNSYPCKDIVKVRCQNEKFYNLDDGITACFLDVYALKETFK